jgi:hypothetical protein
MKLLTEGSEISVRVTLRLDLDCVQRA